MKTRLLNFLNVSIKIVIIVFVVSLIETSSMKVETKIENINLNKTLDLAAMTKASSTNLKKEEILAVYVGDLTGYGADCPLCSGRLGCSPYLDVRDGTTEYEDKEYGKVRIVASSRKLKCGSIITFNSMRVSTEPVIAIVLDRGVGGTSIDLLTESESFAGRYVGRSEIIYTVLRDGWNKVS